MPFRITPTGPKSRPVAPPVVRPKKRKAVARQDRATPKTARRARGRQLASSSPTAPYAPTAKGRRGERKELRRSSRGKSKSAKRTRRLAKQDRRRARQRKALSTPSLERSLAKQLRREAKKLRRYKRLGYGPYAKPRTKPSSTPRLEPADRDTGDGQSREEKLAASVDVQVVEPAKRAKVLPKDKTTGQKIYQQIAEWGPVALTGGPELKAAFKALQTAARGVEVSGVRVGGTKALRRVAKPRQAESRGVSARAAASERAAKRAATKQGGKLKRAGKAALRTERRADKRVARRLAGTPSGREALAQAPVAGKIAKGAAAQSLPVVRGHERAVVESPGPTAMATARMLPGLVTVPVGVAANVGKSAGRAGSEALHSVGIPGFRSYSKSEITGPVREEAQAQIAFAKQVAKVVTADDAEEVQRAVEEELGLLLPIVTGLGAGAALGRVSRGKITAAVRRGAEKARKRVGREHGANRGQPKVFENVAQRKRGAVRAANARGRIRRETADRARGIARAASKAKGSEVLREVPGQRKPVKIRTGDVASFLVAHDVREVFDDPVAALAEVRRVKSTWKELPEGVRADPTKITSRDVVAYIERRPEILRDPNLHKEIQLYREQARLAREVPGLNPEHSERARLLPVASTRDIPFPEERIPESARGATRAEATRGRTAKDVLRRESKSDRQRAKRLKKKAATREGRARAMRAELKVRERSESGRAVNTRVAERVKRAEAQARTLREGAKRAEAEAQLKDAARRELKDPAVQDQLLAEFAADVEATGRSPEYVHRGTGADSRVPVVGAGGAKLSQFPGKSKMRKGTAEEYGVVEEGLGPMLRESIARPVSRRESYKALLDWLDEEEIRVDGKGDFTSAQTEALFSEGVKGVRVNPRTHVKLPRQIFKRAEDYFAGKDVDAMRLAADLKEALDLDAQATFGRGSDRVYKIVPRESAEEFFAQMTTQMVHPVASKVNRWTSYAILGTSPSWVMWQIVAEYAQAAYAQPKLLNPAYARKLMRAYNEMPAHQRWAFESWTGVVSRQIEKETDIKLGLESGDMAAALDAYRTLDKLPGGRLLREIPQTITAIDRWKGGRLRVLVTAAKVDADLNGRLNKYLRGVGGLYRTQRELAESLAGKPLSEQLAFVAEHPKLAKRYQTYLDDVMGNWSALTRNERLASQMVIFYPFIRMSLRFAFWSFPKQHPIKAAMAYWLGQQNANVLEGLLGGEPSFFSQWAQVPLYNGSGDPKLLDLARVAPGSNALLEALGGGDVPPGAAALRVSQPALVALITAATGVSPLSGEQESDAGWQALAQILSLSPLTRTADRLVVPGGEKRVKGQPPIFGETRRQDALDKLFIRLREEEGTLAEAVRAMGFKPPRQLEYDRDLAKLGRILEQISKNKSEKRASRTSELYEQGVPKAKAERIVGKMKERFDKGQERLNSLFDKYRIPYEAESERFLDFYGDVFYSGTPSATEQLDRELGIQSTPSKSDLDRELGIPTAPSREDLDKELGIGG